MLGTRGGTGTLGGNSNILVGHSYVFVAGRNGRACEGNIFELVLAFILLGQLGTEGINFGFFD